MSFWESYMNNRPDPDEELIANHPWRKRCNYVNPNTIGNPPPSTTRDDPDSQRIEDLKFAWDHFTIDYSMFYTLSKNPSLNKEAAKAMGILPKKESLNDIFMKPKGRGRGIPRGKNKTTKRERQRRMKRNKNFINKNQHLIKPKNKVLIKTVKHHRKENEESEKLYQAQDTHNKLYTVGSHDCGGSVFQSKQKADVNESESKQSEQTGTIHGWERKQDEESERTEILNINVNAGQSSKLDIGGSDDNKVEEKYDDIQNAEEFCDTEQKGDDQLQQHHADKQNEELAEHNQPDAICDSDDTQNAEERDDDEQKGADEQKEDDKSDKDYDTDSTDEDDDLLDMKQTECDDNDIKKYQCPMCGKKEYNTLGWFLNHVKKCGDEDKCFKCGKTYTSKGWLQKHLKYCGKSKKMVDIEHNESCDDKIAMMKSMNKCKAIMSSCVHENESQQKEIVN